jgi:hypothetical protein
MSAAECRESFNALADTGVFILNSISLGSSEDLSPEI